MRIADRYLTELIQNEGELKSGPVGNLAVLRLALDLREAREKIAVLECGLETRLPEPKRTVTVTAKRRLQVVEEHTVTGRFGDPRGDYEETVAVTERVVGSKVDYRA